MQKMSVVLFSAPSHECARTIIRQLVEDQSIACGSIIPGCTSLYLWQGALQETAEVQALIKLPSEQTDSVLRTIEQMHPYDVPEIIVLPVAAGLPAYIEWVASYNRQGQ